MPDLLNEVRESEQTEKLIWRCYIIMVSFFLHQMLKNTNSWAAIWKYPLRQFFLIDANEMALSANQIEAKSRQPIRVPDHSIIL